MPDNVFYVYGVVRSENDSTWQETGIAEKNVYMVGEGNFSALVHDCEEEPYTAEDPNKIKEMIVTHNRILDRTMEDFGGVIPLSFNTIIKKGTNSARFNLIKWLNDDQKRLERIWNEVKGKKEYGIRIYYEKDKLIQEASEHKEVKKIEKNIEGKGQGLSYLLQGKAKSQTQEIFQEKVNKLKQEFYEGVKGITKDLIINPSRISLEEEKDLLLSLSVLIEEKQVSEIKEFLEKKAEDFSFQLAGPFAPYSFVEK